MYAVLDIETTGGKYNEEGITEIAIYKFDGNEVVDQFISLINPEKEIQPTRVTVATQPPVSQPDPPVDKAVQSSPSYQGGYSATKKMLEYGSDSSSDTGVCSLSSTEGDYSLSTLV